MYLICKSIHVITIFTWPSWEILQSRWQNASFLWDFIWGSLFAYITYNGRLHYWVDSRISELGTMVWVPVKWTQYSSKELESWWCSFCLFSEALISPSFSIVGSPIAWGTSGELLPCYNVMIGLFCCSFRQWKLLKDSDQECLISPCS